MYVPYEHTYIFTCTCTTVGKGHVESEGGWGVIDLKFTYKSSPPPSFYRLIIISLSKVNNLAP